MHAVYRHCFCIQNTYRKSNRSCRKYFYNRLTRNYIPFLGQRGQNHLSSGTSPYRPYKGSTPTPRAALQRHVHTNTVLGWNRIYLISTSTRIQCGVSGLNSLIHTITLLPFNSCWLEILRFTFTPNGRRECVPRDQVSPYFPFTLYCFFSKISSFVPVLTIGVVRDCFYLLIFYSEKFSTWVWLLLETRILISLLLASWHVQIGPGMWFHWPYIFPSSSALSQHFTHVLSKKCQREITR